MTKRVLFFGSLLCFFLFCLFVCVFFKGSLWSFLGGFLGTFLVLCASAFAAYRRLQNALSSEEAIALAHATTSKYDEEEESTEEQQESHQIEENPSRIKLKSKTPFFKKISLYQLKGGLFLSFTPWRILAYACLVVIFLALLRHEEWEIFSFFGGSFLATLLFLIVLLYRV